MKYIKSILSFFVLLLLIGNLSHAKDSSTTIKKQVKQFLNDGPLLVRVNNKTTERCFTPESFFIANIKKMLNVKSVICYERNGSKLVIIGSNATLRKKSYRVLFGDESLSNDSEDQIAFKCAMANSICNFYGMSIEELLHLRQQKVVIDKTKKEINKLFDESLDIINKYSNDQRIDEAKLAKLIADELIKKQNEPLAPDAQIPTVPTLL